MVLVIPSRPVASPKPDRPDPRRELTAPARGCYFKPPFAEGSKCSLTQEFQFGGRREEDISAPSQEPQANPRVPQANEDPCRARGLAPPPPSRPQAADGQRLQEVDRVVTAGGEGFPRARRVRKRVDYLRIQSQGRRFSTPHFLVFMLPSSHCNPQRSQGSRPPDRHATRFGITVSRKVGDAVTRNRVKRWIREYCRRWASALPPSLDIVVVARPQAAGAGFAPISAELASLTKRLR